MRISTTMQFTSNLRYIQNSNSKVDETSDRYNSGLKFQKAGENPSGMASKVKYEGAIASYDQYAKVGTLAQNSLSEEETALESMWETLSSINTRLQQCVNGSNDESSLKAISAEIAQLRDHLFDLCNTQNTEGEYIFSGANSSVPTYTLTTTGHYKCQADGASRSVVVSPSVSVQVSDSGHDIFEICKTSYTFSASNTSGSSMTFSGIREYGEYESLYKTYYDPSGAGTNKLALQINPGNPPTFSLSDPSGNTIETGEVDISGSTKTIKVRGMEFTIGNITAGDTVEITLDPPKTDNMLNILTDIVADINDETMGSAEKIKNINKCQQDVLIALSHYDSYRGQIGARQNAITNVLGSNEALSDIKVESKANISEVDAFEAASDLIKAQNQLSVSRQIYSMLNRQSLFDYI